MPVTTEIAPESLQELEELRRRHAEAHRILRSSEEVDPLGRMVVFVTAELGEAWEREAPRLTGTLASATRERYYQGQGRVFIDPTVVNPLGGRPAIYGPRVHDEYGNLWVQRVYTTDAPRALQRAGVMFFDEIDEVYQK